MASHSRAAARYHGDQAAVPGMLDFAVDVRASEPASWLVDRLSAGLTDLGRYPSALDERRAAHAAAARPGRSVDEVVLLAGESLPSLEVLRSLTKTWALPGPRVGYALGPRDVLDRLTAPRAAMADGLSSIGLDVIDGSAPFVLFTVPDAALMRKHLDGKEIAVRPDWPVLVEAIAESLR